MNFDRVAPAYPALETMTFGGVLQQARLAFAEEVIGRKSALIIGDGDGRGCAEIVSLNTQAQIDYVESSRSMIRGARSRLGGNSHVHFHHADFRDWTVPADGARPRKYDFVATHFFLDCFPTKSLAEVVRKISSLTGPGAIWLLTDFNIPPRGWRRVHAQAWLAAMYSFFRVAASLEATHLVDPAPMLTENGFGLLRERSWRFDLIRSQLWQRV